MYAGSTFVDVRRERIYTDRKARLQANECEGDKCIVEGLLRKVMQFSDLSIDQLL